MIIKIENAGSPISLETTVDEFVELYGKINVLETINGKKEKLSNGVSPVNEIYQDADNNSGYIYTGKEIARRLGIAQQTISNWRNAGHIKRINNLYNYEECLGVYNARYNKKRAEAVKRHRASQNPKKVEATKLGKSVAKTSVIDGYPDYSKKINKIIREKSLSINITLIKCYKLTTCKYGISWEQLAKEFFDIYHRGPLSTLELACWLDTEYYKNNANATQNLFISVVQNFVEV